MGLEQIGGKPKALEQTVKTDQNQYGIDVDRFIEKYAVKDLRTVEVLKSFPTLCYLLGKVTETPQGRNLEKDLDTYYLTEGSGMFALEKPDDAMEWKGIFNHIMGSSRQVYFLADKMNSMTEAEKYQLANKGFNMHTFVDVDPILLRDFMFVSHAARRQVDEWKRHGLEDSVHREGESEDLTENLLREENAPEKFLSLMRVENHEFIIASATNGRLPNLPMNVLMYCDWTFGQKPDTLKERFAGLRKSHRKSDEILDALEDMGTYFQEAVFEVFGPEIFDQMTKAGPYDWETQIREAYCSPSGLKIEEVFPNYQK